VENTPKKLPMAKVNINTPYYQVEVMATKMDNCIHDLIIGNIPGVRLPCNPITNWNLECSITNKTKASDKNTKVKGKDNIEVD